MTRLDRRFDNRISFETFLTTYVDDKPVRGFTSNISETGLFLNTLHQDPNLPLAPVGLELALPGYSESLWVAGHLTHDLQDNYFTGRGVRFTAMAERHAKILREFCFKTRRRSRMLYA